MKTKLNIGDTFTIPTGCKATIKNNKIVIEKEEGKFKNGNILYSFLTNKIVIFKRYTNDCKDLFENYCIDDTDIYSNGWFVARFRHATKEERRAFFDELKKKGLRWNSETKTMEKIRKRVKYGDFYLAIDAKHEVIKVCDNRDDIDGIHWETGNYYLLNEEKQAEEDAKTIKEIFEKRIKIK